MSAFQTAFENGVDAMFEDAYGDTLVARLVRAGTPPPEAAKVLVAYKQFLVIKVEGDDFDAMKFSPPPLVDEMWHLHVLDTRHYTDACLGTFGRIMHHDPDGGADPAARNARIGATHVALTRLFGTAYDTGIWRWNAPPTKASGRVSPSTADDGVESLTIVLRSLTGDVTSFKVKTTTTFDKVFNAYAKRRGAESDSFRFIFGDQSILEDQTPWDLDMSDGATIYAIQQLRGC